MFRRISRQERERRAARAELETTLQALRSNERAFTEAFASPPPLSVEVLEALSRYDWPGNLRELGHLARSLCICCTCFRCCLALAIFSTFS